MHVGIPFIPVWNACGRLQLGCPRSKFLQARWRPVTLFVDTLFIACNQFLVGYQKLVNSGLLKKDRIPNISNSTTA